MSYSYEKEQERLLCLFEEVPTPSASEVADDDQSLQGDNLETLEYDTNSEEDIPVTDDVQDHVTVQPATRVPCLIGKDGTRWKKHLGLKRNIRTRQENLYIQLPGP
ncbi:unnamed protein product [Acanthoscelides obtectus]|uniref:Uncharacterized protein n=1 Tax=Acanthoscelides obtectus TaxID=200917 RepID=A0A9P0LS55_ACAOB|nr:unnamed protein product [Acanthoscelides obtectus]CAK1671377.1 hypothetical protein AOBTE_LOCUS28240 [Acanthoscelides obtectus]